MKRANELIVGLAVMAALVVIVWALYAVGDNMPRGVTTFSQDVYELHMTILGIVTVIGILVFSAMFTSIILHRKSRGAEAARFSHSTQAEITWTVIPILILVAMAVPATRVLIDMETTAGADLDIKVTGYQWLWEYEYLDSGVSFFSALDRESNAVRQVGSGTDPRTVENYLLEVDNRLVVPTGTRIRFLLTAADVIHSWWVPALGWKRDAIPGRVNEAWTRIDEPGVYRGQCAELCGKDHGFMPIVVEAVPPEEFEAWIAERSDADSEQAAEAEREWSRDELMARGEDIYNAQCATCHQTDGTGLKPAFPALAGSDVTTGNIRAHLDLVLRGREGTAMAGFSSRLSPQDIAATVTYTRNAWGNDTGDIVQPATVSDLNRG